MRCRTSSLLNSSGSIEKGEGKEKGEGERREEKGKGYYL